jgi:cytochrome c oxidase assembly factor CtaG
VDSKGIHFMHYSRNKNSNSGSRSVPSSWVIGWVAALWGEGKGICLVSNRISSCRSTSLAQTLEPIRQFCVLVMSEVQPVIRAYYRPKVDWTSRAIYMKPVVWIKFSLHRVEYTF